jgi:hypothetical protein
MTPNDTTRAPSRDSLPNELWLYPRDECTVHTAGQPTTHGPNGPMYAHYTRALDAQQPSGEGDVAEVTGGLKTDTERAATLDELAIKLESIDCTMGDRIHAAGWLQSFAHQLRNPTPSPPSSVEAVPVAWRSRGWLPILEQWTNWDYRDAAYGRPRDDKNANEGQPIVVEPLYAASTAPAIPARVDSTKMKEEKDV